MSDAMVSTVGVTKSGAVEIGESGTGFTVVFEDGPTYEGGAFIGETTHAAAEFNALLWGLENARAAKADFIEISLRDQHLINQMMGMERVDSPGLKTMYAQAIMLLQEFKGFAFVPAYDGIEERAAALAERAISEHAVIGDFLSHPSLKQQTVFLGSAVDKEETETASSETTGNSVSSIKPERMLSTDSWRPAFPTDDDPLEPSPVDDDPLSAVFPNAKSGKRDSSTSERGGASKVGDFTFSGYRKPEPAPAVEVEETVSAPEAEGADIPASESGSNSDAALPPALAAYAKYASSSQARDEMRAAWADESEEDHEQKVEAGQNLAASLIEASLGNANAQSEPAAGTQVSIPFDSSDSQGSIAETVASAMHEYDARVSSGKAPQTSSVLDASGLIEIPQKTAVVGVTGCIAAYKACEVVRGLQKAGYHVKVMMTENATRFVGPATFKALTSEPVAISLFDAADDPVHHISLAKEADLMVIAPCTGNVMAKIAHGVADDLLTTTVLAARGPVLIAPAMNSVMWGAAATQDNLRVLERRGFHFTRPVEGHLACGDEGAGKLADVDDIVEDAVALLKGDDDLAGLKVLVTAGPTYEPIDPVRFIGNRSSGRMGYAVAAAAARRGAHVTLVSGPTSLPDPHNVETIRVTTAEEMLEACRKHFRGCALAVFSAAVSDFAPVSPRASKIKKNAGGLREVALRENPDILATLAAEKGATYVVGFAAETGSVIEYAQDKLVTKHANMIVANDVSGKLGFDTPDNKVWFVTQREVQELPVMSKSDIAEKLLDAYVDNRAVGK